MAETLAISVALDNLSSCRLTLYGLTVVCNVSFITFGVSNVFYLVLIVVVSCVCTTSLGLRFCCLFGLGCFWFAVWSYFKGFWLHYCVGLLAVDVGMFVGNWVCKCAEPRRKSIIEDNCPERPRLHDKRRRTFSTFKCFLLSKPERKSDEE